MSHPSLREALREAIARAEEGPGPTLDLAEHGDIAALDALNEQVVAALPLEGLFMRQRPAFFAAVLDAGGAIVLARESGVPVAYAVCLPVGPAFAPFFETDGADALLFGAAVLPEARRQGLQRDLIELRCDALWASGATAIQATVSPRNHRSLVNLVTAGFEVVALRDMLDGFPRFVIERRRGRSASSPHDLMHEPLPPAGTLDAHARRLARGERGVRAALIPDPVVCYSAGGDA